MQFDHYLNLVLISLFLIIAVRYAFDKLRHRHKSLGRIPGLKKTDPKFGNLLEMKACGSLHQFLEKLHGRFGDIATFHWADTTVVSIASHELFRGVQTLFDQPVVVFANLIEFFGDNSLANVNGDEVLLRRKEYDKAFQHSAIIRYISDIEKVGRDNLDYIKRLTTPVKSIEQMCYALAVRGILKTCLLPSSENEEFYEKIIKLYAKVFAGMHERIAKGETFLVTDEKEIEFQKDKSELYGIIRKVINERLHVLENKDLEDEELLLIDRIILFHRDINMDLIETESLIFMVGGFHTSGNAMAFCIYYLAKNQECQEKLYEEITKKPLQFSNTMECYKKILDMKYLRACIDETLRLSQVAPYAGRISHEDKLLKSYKIPANTPIILALGVSFKNEGIFHDNEKFLPERFIDNDFPSFSFVPFGFAGKRKCPGERFSYLEISILLIQLVEKFTFSLCNPDQKVNKVYGIVTHMDQEVSINFRER